MSRLADRPTARLEPSGDGRLALSGQAGFGNAAALLEEGIDRFAGEGPLVIDLSGLTHADSAGVALLIEWVFAARRAGRELRFDGLPDQVRAIARLGGVDDFLPVA